MKIISSPLDFRSRSNTYAYNNWMTKIEIFAKMMRLIIGNSLRQYIAGEAAFDRRVIISEQFHLILASYKGSMAESIESKL